MNKLQYLLIKELLNKGTVELVLPDGVTIEIGITQEDKAGKPQKVDNYCYVVASREDKSVLLDAYNLGLRYEAEKDTIVFEDENTNDDGKKVCSLDIF